MGFCSGSTQPGCCFWRCSSIDFFMSFGDATLQVASHPSIRQLSWTGAMSARVAAIRESSLHLTEETPERLSALLEVLELVVARARRAEQHDVPGGREARGMRHGRFEIAVPIAVDQLA